MRNVVGQPVTGDNFFQRKLEIRKILRKIDAGASLYLSAPRRVGKTSIMFYLRDNKEEVNGEYLYVPTEAVYSSEEFFQLLFRALVQSSFVKDKLSVTDKVSSKVSSFFGDLIGRLNKIGVMGVIDVGLSEAASESYSQIFDDFVSKLSLENGERIVFMIDEFPSTIENIVDQSGKEAAVKFLKLNRAMRQKSTDSVQFIYTGSVGLQAVVSKLMVPESINDLDTAYVNPLSVEEGEKFVELLFEYYEVLSEEGVVSYVVKKVEWLMPFFIQLAVQELIDVYDKEGRELNQGDVDSSFSQIYSRRNDIHFESYEQRLKDVFDDGEYDLVLCVLNKLAENDSVNKEELKSKALELFPEIGDKGYRNIIASLEYDGYIHEGDGGYSFNSPILKNWWKKNNY